MTARRRIAVVVEEGRLVPYFSRSLPLLRDRGFEPHLVSVRERGPLHADLESRGIRTHELDVRVARDYPVAVARFAALVRRERIDLAHANEAIPGAVAAGARVLAPRLKVIYLKQNTATLGKQRVLEGVAARGSHLVMGVSEAAARAAQRRYGLHPARLAVARSGVPRLRDVPPDELRDLRSRLGIPEGAPVVVMVARLRPEKGHRVLLESLPELRRSLPVAPHLVFAGDGPDRPGLEAAVERSVPDLVHLVGHQHDVAPWHHLGDVIAMPSEREGLPIAAVEAISAGRVLVANRVGGLPEVIEDGTSGVLVTDTTPAGWARALAAVLQDASLRERLGRGALRRYEERFTPEAMVSGWVEAYRRLLPPGPTPREG